MTIHVGQHYRSVNGKLVLVHEHDKQGNAAQHHEPEHHQHVSDDEFEKVMAHHAPKEDEAHVSDDEFDSIAGSYHEPETGDEFDNIMGNYGGDEDEEPAKEEPKKTGVTAAELEGIGGKPWKEKGHDRIYFNGLHKLYLESDGPHKDVPYEEFKGAKLWFDNKDGQFHSKGINDFYLDSLVKHITKKAKEWGTQNVQTMPDTMQPQSVDSGPAIGTVGVPFDQLKPGMEFKLSTGKDEHLGWKVMSVSGNMATLEAGAPGQKIIMYDISPTKWEGSFSGSLKLVSKDGDVPNPEPKKERSKGPKIGDHVDFSDLDAGMVLASGAHMQLVVVDADSSPLWMQNQFGDIFEVSSGVWAAGKHHWILESKDGKGFKPEPLKSGIHVGDTKVINGKTYRLNENHRWELVDESEAAQKTSATLDQIADLKPGDAIYIDGVMVKKSTYSGNLIVAKVDTDGKALPKKLKDALKEMHPAGYKAKKQYFLVDKGKLAEFADAMDGMKSGALKAKPKPKAEKPKTVPVPVLEGFPFNQIGPQKGSNPGGLYEDKFGKKWYIKFPASEDHAKNELLASKLYKALGLDAPLLKLVKKDGQVGIASAFQEGLKNDGAALKAGAAGAKDGFGADAWLANWDSAGLSFDNMPIDKDGKAVRIDVGGSLLYRAQGGPKGDAFGNTVPEVDSLRDPKTNAQTAAIFGSMTKDEIDQSIAKVLEIPDEIIKKAVDKFGPGDEAAKKALAAKLIARKNYLAKRFPEAMAIAFPPKPDPSALPVRPDTFPTAPNFGNWEGGGKGLSSKPEVNAQNQDAADKIYALATAGNLTALKALTITPVGASSPISMSNHPSQHIQKMYNQCVGTLETLADPNAKAAAKDWGLDTYDGGDIQDLSSACQSYPYGVTKHTVPVAKRLGFWMSIADMEGGEHLAPAKTHNVTPAEHAVGKASNAGIPQVVRQFMKDVKVTGSANNPYREGKEKDNSGNNCRDVIKGAYEHAAEFQEGATIKKFIDFHTEPGMKELLLGKPKGHVFQNPGSMCASLKPNWNWSGEAELEIVYAKGAKALYNIGVGSHDNEGEVTTLPGQRFMILESKAKGPKGGAYFKLLMLPPDPTYVDTLYQKASV